MDELQHNFLRGAAGWVKTHRNWYTQYPFSNTAKSLMVYIQAITNNDNHGFVQYTNDAFD